jgi:hypothetical protein
MRSSMLGVIAERRRCLAVAGSAAAAQGAAADLLDVLLLAKDDSGVPLTGGWVVGGGSRGVGTFFV